MLVSAQALIVAMFGGVGTVWGPVIGAVVLVPLSALLDAKLSGTLPGIQGVVFGLAIIAVIMLAPDGVFWKVRDLVHKRADAVERKRRSRTSEIESATRQQRVIAAIGGAQRTATLGGDFTVLSNDTSPHVLEIRNLSKAFGGLLAVSDVSLDVQRGEILGVIGPNGAGKTTFFNLLNGFTAPDRGTVLLNGDDVVGMRASEICRRGVGRTFQVVKPFRRMSIADNVVIGAYVRTRSDEDALGLAAHALAAVGLQADAELIAGSASNLQLRLMELARALASQPTLLLLDEIFAGLTTAEVQSVTAVIRGLRALGLTVVIIEHTMHAMVRLVDRFVVLDHGAVLSEGVPDAVTKDRRVIEAYLGRKWAANARDR
jgi:branched-chain amino acid transport system permease protein